MFIFKVYIIFGRMQLVYIFSFNKSKHGFVEGKYLSDRIWDKMKEKNTHD
jgi:hypothetical protein